MLTIEVCVGSSCFLRGAPEIIDLFKKLIQEKAPGKVEIKGTFCLEQCTKGVTVRVLNKTFSGLHVEDARRLFEEEILPHVGCE